MRCNAKSICTECTASPKIKVRLEFSLLRLDLEHGEHATDMSSVAGRTSASAIIVADELRPDSLAPRLC